MEGFQLTELIPGLPDQLGLECLTRLHYTAHRAVSQVCRQWRQLLKNREFFHHRRKYGFTHKIACLVQALPGSISPNESNPSSPPIYGITVVDPVSKTWERLEPIPKYTGGLPLFCQLASSEGKLVVMGGWDPVSYDPVTDVFVFDFTMRQWKKEKEMPLKDSFFAVGTFEDRVYLAGGHDRNKNALKSAWVYDLGGDEWTELNQMSQERDECEGVVIGNEFWVVSGYGTESQGEFEGSAEAYEFGSGRWRRVEGVWEEGRCPRSCVGAGGDGKLVSWAELDSAVRVGACGIMLGARTLITGSEGPGAPQGFYMVELKGMQNGKLERIDVPEEFSGFVQSGCCVEV